MNHDANSFPSPVRSFVCRGMDGVILTIHPVTSGNSPTTEILDLKYAFQRIGLQEY
jgi:hypothetical protein